MIWVPIGLAVLAVLMFTAAGLILVWTAPTVTLAGALCLTAIVVLVLAFLSFMLAVLVNS